MDEESSLAIAADRHGDPVQPTPADSLGAAHHSHHEITFVDLFDPLVHEPTIAAASDTGATSAA
ncbi:hypothetical protein ACIP98_26035 [Streptomyces sp. NPDC088354]|uniref:hypothetical protein n=1 Tax=unclassified Streptomyces TaxID=2593676 RepID=UPI0029B4E73A|nr:hypothetical protein [Streptomyces sp. MI02-7b]MDX3073919.1 hypothetical protein [Streptomyces sp. MI02-7b]